MKDILAITGIMIAVVATAAVAGAMTTITTFDIFAQKSSNWDQLVNDCWYNNVTACKVLEGNSTTAYMQPELNVSS